MTFKYTRRQRVAAEVGFSILMIILGTGLPLLFSRFSTIKNSPAALALEALAAAGLGLQLILYLTKFNKRVMAIYFMAAALIAPILILLAV